MVALFSIRLRGPFGPYNFTVNELPPKARFRATTLAGLWFGRKKPDMSLFMKEFAFEANAIGLINWTHNNKTYCSSVHVIGCSVDSPARAAVQNHVLYAGYFGCPWCVIRGQYIDGHVRYIASEDERPEMRTAERTTRNAEIAARLSARAGHCVPVEGVKGPSSLSLLPHFDPVWGYSVDYMHCALLGVSRQFTELLLSSSSYDKRFYIGSTASVERIDKRLLSISPPHCFTRLPRSVRERSNWKASEWKNWILYYFLLCTADILPLRYWRHMCQFSEALHILLSTELTENMVKKADHLLSEFVCHVPTLYGESSVTFNVHQLQHLASTARNLGPLWANSAFSFESGNGRLLKQITAAKGVPHQVIERVIISQDLHEVLSSEQLPPDASSYCKGLLGCEPIQNAVSVGNVCLLGKGKFVSTFTSHEQTALAEVLGECPTSALEYKRFITGGEVFHTVSYAASMRRNCSAIVCSDDASYCILRVLKVACEEHERCVLLCKPVNETESVLPLPQHITECFLSPLRDMKCVNANDIVSPCLFVNFKHEEVTYLCHLPNTIERD
ncbi:uncharacterized protein LOC135374052 [Ornithodoros turicata]|uniref:uncharacterized protein LOC135374052 n=1 Tax=Ornithodoros turicata TaxID=34597 RepID=UPI003138B4BB